MYLHNPINLNMAAKRIEVFSDYTFCSLNVG